jgi:hypothetical protein
LKFHVGEPEAFGGAAGRCLEIASEWGYPNSHIGLPKAERQGFVMPSSNSISRSARVAAIALVAAAWLALAPIAQADGDSGPGYVGGLKLVAGATPFPDFHGATPLGGGPGYSPPPGFAMTLSLPDNPQQQFLFSPRVPPLAVGGPANVGRRTYLGLSIDVGEQTGLYGTIGLGGSMVNDRAQSIEEYGSRGTNAPLLLHGGFELGYRLNQQNNISLSIDRSTAPDGLAGSDAVGNVRLRYGLKF